MKNLTIVLTLFVCSFYGIAQSTIDLKVGGNYTFIETQPILMESSSSTLNIYSNLKKYKNNKLEKETNTFEAGHTVRILNIENGIVYFKYWKSQFKEKNRGTIRNSKAYNAKLDRHQKYNENYVENIVFSLPIYEFEKLTQQRYDSFRGVKLKTFSAPIRVRGFGSKDKFTFEQTLSLGENLSIQFGYDPLKEDRYIELTAGVAITQINLNYEVYDSEGVFLSNESATPAALTFAFGGVWHFASNVNAGVFVGWDHLKGNDQSLYKWEYNQKPWIGLGVNLSFGKEKAQNSQEKENQKLK